MRRMIALVSCLMSLVAHAEESDRPYGNIMKGDLGLSASFFYRSSSNDRGSELDLFNTTTYFVADRFAIGGIFSFNDTSDDDATALLGPVVSYHFWAQDRWASRVQLEYSSGLTDATVRGRLGALVGLEYFITQSVAAGPYLLYRHLFSRGADWDNFYFGGTLEIYL
jgi:hypothetical protein